MIKTTRKAVLGVLFVLIIALAGCKGITRTKDIDRPLEVNFRTGTDGLVLSFPAGTSRELFENDPQVRMVVEIRNRGAFPQKEDVDKFTPYIWVSGFDRNILDLRPATGNNLLDKRSLEGKTVFNPDGGISSVTLDGQTFSLPEGTTAYKPVIIVSTTYNYETIASPLACIDPHPRSTDVREKPCRVENFRSLSVGASQGAPVAVTRVEEDVTSNSVLFRIFIQNVGKGLVIDERQIRQDPANGYDFDMLDFVRISDVSAGNRQLTCTPSIGQRVKLIEGKAFIFCKLPIAGIEGVFTSPLNIKLDYGYVSSIQQEIKIFKEILT